MMTAVFGPGIVNSIIAIGLYNIPTFARITRASSANAWSGRAVRARGARRRQGRVAHHDRARAAQHRIGADRAGTIRFAIAILAEAALSYLGLGTQPPQPSWGRMLSEAQTLLFQAPPPSSPASRSCSRCSG